MLEHLVGIATVHRCDFIPILEQWWAVEILKLRVLYKEGRARWLEVEPWIDKERPVSPRLFTREELRIIDYMGSLYDPDDLVDEEVAEPE